MEPDSPKMTHRRESATLLESIQKHRKRLAVLLGIMFFIAYVASSAPDAPSQVPDVVSQRKWSLRFPSLPLFRPKIQPIIHPIPKLMSTAQANFKAQLKRQSTTLPQAVKEYRRRYGRDPPKGFDAWWEFAKQNGVRIVDDYDQLVKDLEPFWTLPGEEVRRRTAQVSTYGPA